MALPKFLAGMLSRLHDGLTRQFSYVPDALDDQFVYGSLVDRLARRTGWHPETVQTALLLLHPGMNTRDDRYFGQHTYKHCLADLRRFEQTHPGAPRP